MTIGSLSCGQTMCIVQRTVAWNVLCVRKRTSLFAEEWYGEDEDVETLGSAVRNRDDRRCH
jgi:hypothetical protein